MTVSFWAFVPFIIAAVVAAWWRPRFVLLLPLVFHAAYLLRSHIVIGETQIPTTLLEVFVGIAIITGMLHWRKHIAKELLFLPRLLLVCVVVFILSATISAVIAPHPRVAWGHWKAFIVEPIAYAAVLLPLLRTNEGRMAAVRALLWGGVVSAGLSLALGVVSVIAPYLLHSIPYTLDFGRLRGIYDVPNSLALILAPLGAFAGALALDSSFPLRQFSRRVLVLFVPTLLLTQSIGGLLSAAFALLCITTRKKAHRVTLSIILVFAVGFVALWMTGRIAHALADSSPFRARLQIWAVSLSLIQEHPLLGTGLGTFEPVYQTKLHEVLSRASAPHILLPQPLEWVVRDPHNIFLSFWLQTGLFGFLSMGTVIILAFRQLRAPNSTTLSIAACAALLTVLLFGFIDVPYMKNDLAVLWWVYIALITQKVSGS